MVRAQIKIKKQYAILILLFMIGVVLASAFVLSSYHFEKQIISKEAFSNLVTVAKNKAGKINEYLFDMEEDLKKLQNSDEVKELLKTDLIVDKDAVKNDVDEKCAIVAKEVNNYLKTHPSMTMKDLQDSREFQEIALQPISKDGYTNLFDWENQIVTLHKLKAVIGLRPSAVEDVLPESYMLAQRIKTESDVSGFYDWMEPDGSINRKYMRMLNLDTRTADDVAVTVVASAYFKNYKILNKESKYLEDFKEQKSYSNVILISSEGYVSYATDTNEELGTNLEWSITSDVRTGLSENYYRVKEGDKISFFGPYVGDYGDIYPKVSAIAPVYENGELLGYVGIIEEMDEILKISEKPTSLAETEESYIVDKDLLLVSPLRNYDFDIMIQSIPTKNSENCFLTEEKDGEPFLNYRGDYVLGAHAAIPKTDWCILSEAYKEEILDVPLKKIIKNIIYLSLVGLVIFISIGYYSFKHYDRIRVVLKNRLSLILLCVLLINMFGSVSALSLSTQVPEKYTEVVAGERLYFTIQIKYPENPKRKDLRLEYEISTIEGDLVAQAKALKAVETQASFVDFIVIPTNAKQGLYVINVKVKDYETLSEETSASFQVQESKANDILMYFLIILAINILIGVIVVLNIVLRSFKEY